MAKQARVRPSWKKWTRKANRRDVELSVRTMKKLLFMHGDITQACKDYERLVIFERAQKKLQKLDVANQAMIAGIINEQGGDVIFEPDGTLEGFCPRQSVRPIFPRDVIVGIKE